MRIRTALASAGVAFALVGMPWSVAEASADAGCINRGQAHYAEHGGLKADSAYHLSRGELPNCEPQKAERKRDDDDRPWRRDEFGFNCTWRGCG